MLFRLFMIVSFLPTFAIGQGSSPGFSSLKLPFHARQAALGEATVGDLTSFSSFMLNPALLAGSHDTEFFLSHQEWIADLRSEFLSSTFPVSFGTIGFSILSTRIAGIEIREQPGPPQGMFSARYGGAVFTAASELSENICAGLSVRYLFERIFIDESDGVGIDAGMTYELEDNGWSFGASILNLGTMSSLRSESTRLPTRIQAGTSYNISINGTLNSLIVGSVSKELYSSANHFAIGAETRYKGFLAFRIGYQSGYDSRSFSAGIGILSLPILFDYSFVPFSYGFGSAHFITLGVRP